MTQLASSPPVRPRRRFARIAIERTLRRAEEVADHRTLEDYEAALRGIPVLGAGAFGGR